MSHSQPDFKIWARDFWVLTFNEMILQNNILAENTLLLNTVAKLF